MRGRKLQVDWREGEQTLYELYNQEKDHQDHTRLQALRLVRQGRTEKEVAQIVGVHLRTVQRWVAWYREGGVGEVLPHRHGGQGGREPKLTPEQGQELKEQACRGEFRTIWDGVRLVKEKFGIEYTYWGMRWVFERLGLKKKVPRRVAPQAVGQAQEAWKKGAWLTS